MAPHFNIDPSLLNQLVQWAFMTIVAAAITWSAKFLAALTRNVISLNEKMAVLLDKVERHDREIPRLDNRIDDLEKSKK